MQYLSYANVMEAVFLMVAALMYMLPLRKKEPIERRFISGLLLGSMLLIGPALVLPQTAITALFLTLFSLLILPFIIYYCVAIRKSAAFYVAIWSVVTTQFFMNLWHVLYALLGVGKRIRSDGAIFLCIIGYYIVGYILVYLTIARRMPEKGKYYIGPRQMTSAILFLLAFEMLDQMMRVVHLGRDDFMYYVVLLVVQLYCVSLLFIQSELFKKSALEKELFTMNMLMKQQEAQYELTRDNIDMINRKCHDLKHQVQALRSVADDESKERYLKELEKSVEIYGAIVKTGNEILDTLLSEKSLICEARDITIHCVIDGKKLFFMDSIDIYALFGNAIDNAIECVEKFSEKEMRFIDICVAEKQHFLYIRFSNPIERAPEYEDDLPKTTKKNKQYHGIGLKSIRHIAEKYGGDISVSTEMNCFNLEVLLPVK